MREKPNIAEDADSFGAHRPAMLALAYRMLGDLARAEDMVQEAWIRWQGREVEVASAKSFLLTIVTRLCLDELGSARARREESRSDRLPEPIDLGVSGFGRIDTLDRISMAFLVLLQRLTPAERAVLLLHEVFDMPHEEIAALLGKTPAACRQLLGRARTNLATEKRSFRADRDEQRRLLLAFIGAVSAGDERALFGVLAEDAVAIVDAGPKGATFGKLRNVGRPITGRKKVAALMMAFASQEASKSLRFEERLLNGEPAIVAFAHDVALSAVVVSVSEGKIHRVFVQIDPERLRHIGRHIGTA